MLKEIDHKDNLSFVIGKDGFSMDRKRGSLIMIHTFKEKEDIL